MAQDPSRPFTGKLLASEGDVAAYLRAHPDFLAQHPELVQHLTPPAPDRGKDVVDLQQFMVQRLQADIAVAHAAHSDLLATSRAHLSHEGRVHKAVLTLLDARSFEQLIQIITTDLAVLLGLDTVTLAVEASDLSLPGGYRSGVRVLDAGTVNDWLGRKDMVINSDIEADADLHGQGAPLLQSEALVRLCVGPQAPQGLLCFGSRDPDIFRQNQSSELLTFLTQVVERCIRTWLRLPG